MWLTTSTLHTPLPEAHSDQPWCADFSGHVPASAHRSADLGAGPSAFGKARA